MPVTESGVAIVAGGAGGIGDAVATRLRRDGYRIAVFDLDASAVDDAVARLGGDDCALGCQVDVRDSGQIAGAVAEVMSVWGRIDALVNSAGVGGAERAENITDEHWERSIGVNLTGTFLMCREVLPVMRRQKAGAIVSVASVAAKRISYNGDAAYTAAKSGVLGLTRHLAFEAADDGIRVNALCPGPTATPMMDRVDPAVVAERQRSVPMGMLVDPSEVAAAAAYLLSDASMVTGVALDVDGGALLGWMSTEEYFRRRT